MWRISGDGSKATFAKDLVGMGLYFLDFKGSFSRNDKLFKIMKNILVGVVMAKMLIWFGYLMWQFQTQKWYSNGTPDHIATRKY